MGGEEREQEGILMGKQGEGRGEEGRTYCVSYMPEDQVDAVHKLINTQAVPDMYICTNERQSCSTYD